MTTRNGGLLAEFRDFALKGNVVDLAVAVIIGGAFGKIISSLVADVLMPAIINPILSKAGTDWREAVIGPGIKIGSFFGAIIDFVIIAFVLFMIIRSIEQAKRRSQRQEELAAAEAPSAPDPAVEAQERLAAATDRLTDALNARNL